MIIQRKQNREYWSGAIINSIPDGLIAAAATLYLDKGLLVFLAIYFGIQAAYLVIWIKNSIWRWVLYFIRTKKQVSRRLLDFLSENDFPRPDPYIESAQAYLEKIVGDETADCTIRVQAAAEIGALNWLYSSMEAQTAIQLGMAYDDALEEYNRRFFAKQE